MADLEARYAILEAECQRCANAKIKQDAEIERLRRAIETVLNKFEQDEADGYRSRDRQYAITILRAAVTKP